MRQYLSTEPARTEQVRIRLTLQEKNAIVSAAKARGMSPPAWLRLVGQRAGGNPSGPLIAA